MEYCRSYSFSCPLFKINGTKLSGRIARHDLVWGNVFGYNTSSANNCVFANGDPGQNGSAGTDRRTLLHQSWFDMPIFFGLQPAIGSRCPRIAVVDEGHAVANENVVLDSDAFTDKCMA